MPAGVLRFTTVHLEPDRAGFNVCSYTPIGRAPYVVLALGSDDLMLHFSDLETLTALAAAVAEACDLLLTAALLGALAPGPEDELPVLRSAVTPAPVDAAVSA